MQLKVIGKGDWEISKISEIEYLFLRRIATAANPEGCDAARRRMYPVGPVASGDLTEGRGSEKDWRDFVLPDQERSFGTAVEVLSEDVEKAEFEAGEQGETIYRISVPQDHTDQWFSALNQARLVLAARYGLPISEADKASRAVIDERWIAHAQSDLYAFIQSFLLETVMKLP